MTEQTDKPAPQWFNVYEDDLLDGPYATKDEADANAGHNRKACVIR